MLQKNKKTIGKIILISIFILALLLRIWGINFGLKDNKGMSDEGGITRNAHRVSVGELRPTQYIYPASTLIYGVGTLYIPIHFLYNLITSSKADLHKQGIINYGWFYFVGRFIVALIGSFTVLILYKIGKTIFNKKVGYSAALFLAVCPLHVRLSHYFTVDVTLTFFLLLVILYSYTHIYKKDNLKSALLPGIFLGLCVATKYTGIIGIVPIISAHILKIIQEQNKNIFYKFKKIIFSKRLWLIFLISIIVFSLVSPYFWFDISKAINNVTREAKNNHSNHGGLGFL
ncbi:MAG: ArnT family glycosyltransferase, partial [Candidatus Thorarchaeota archaeon]